MSKAAKTLLARILCDVPQHNLKAGDIVSGPEAVIKEMTAIGAVDPHKDAVAYAREQGAKTIELKDEAADDSKVALQAEIKSMSEQLAAAADADKPALQEQLKSKQDALASLE